MEQPQSKKINEKAGMLARQFAVEWLFEIIHARKTLDEVLAKAEDTPKWQKLEPRDKAFTRAILMAALRHRGDLEWLIAQFLEKMPPRKTRVSEVLMIGATQLVFLDVPPHAAIDMAVRHVKTSDKSRHLAKLVNAVLRRISEQGAKLLAQNPDPYRNIPPLLLNRWRQHFGSNITNQIVGAILRPAALDVVAKTDPLALAKTLSAHTIGGHCLRLANRGSITHLPGFSEGDWWVQDFAAYLPTTLFGQIEGKHVLDLCAAPGGKAAALLAQGADVTCVDVSENRLSRLRQNMKRLGMSPKIVAEDVLTYTPPHLVDAVLLDAPCSATGTIRRHPDILHLKSEDTILQLGELQQKMLARALDFLKPGGTLIFCTCSLEPEEGEMQIERCLDAHPNVRRQAIETHEVFGQKEWITKAGDLRLYPFYSLPADPALPPELVGMDGFFVSRLVVG